MSVGTATAIGISAAIGAGTSIYSAKKSSDAAHDAAAVQQKGASDALALQKQMYDQQRQDFEPYRQTGLSALGLLGKSVPGYGPGNQNLGAAPPVQSPSPSPMMPPPLGGSQNFAPPTMDGQGGTGRPAMRQAMNPFGGGPQGMGTLASMAPTGGSAMDLVTVQAPTGETARMPRAQAQQAVLKGAKIVG